MDEHMTIWSRKTLLEKDADTLAWQQYYVGHRDIGSETIEEKIAMFANPKNQPEYYGKFWGKDFGDELRKYQQRFKHQEKFTFYSSIQSPFSYEYNRPFTATTLLVEGLGHDYPAKRKDLLNNCFPYNEQQYTSLLQFMSYHKAMCFLDRETAKRIMQTGNIKELEKLGKRVKKFDDFVWQYYRSKIAYEGNKAKFRQHKDLLESLHLTGGTTIVNAASNHNIWAIGSISGDLPLTRAAWNGKNLAGEILTMLRTEFAGVY